jgi:hypothetical protein
MTKSHVRRTETGYKANVGGATHPRMETPNRRSDASMVDPADGREEGKPYLRRSRFSSACHGPTLEQSRALGSEKSAEAVVAAGAVRPRPRAESSIAGSRLHDSTLGSAVNSAIIYRSRGPRHSGEAEPTCCARGGIAVGDIQQRTSPGGLWPLDQSEKPPYTSKYVRWCGRTGP